MQTKVSGLSILRCDSEILRGEVVFSADRFYPPHIVEAWKNDLQRRTGERFEWQYKDGRYPELHISPNGNRILLENAIDSGNDLESFARRFKTQQTQRSR